MDRNERRQAFKKLFRDFMQMAELIALRQIDSGDIKENPARQLIAAAEIAERIALSKILEDELPASDILKH